MVDCFKNLAIILISAKLMGLLAKKCKAPQAVKLQIPAGICYSVVSVKPNVVAITVNRLHAAFLRVLKHCAGEKLARRVDRVAFFLNLRRTHRHNKHYSFVKLFPGYQIFYYLNLVDSSIARRYDILPSLLLRQDAHRTAQIKLRF